MRSQKGYSLLEILLVTLIMALIIALISTGVLQEINNARGSAFLSKARMVYMAAQIAILETQATTTKISDHDYMMGLSGTVDDALSLAQVKLSKKMTALLAPDVVLSREPGVNVAQVSFVIEDAKILSMSYETIVDRRLFTIVIDGGEASVSSKRIND